MILVTAAAAAVVALALSFATRNRVARGKLRFAAVVATLGGWLLAMRNTVVAVLGDDFMTFARAKGLPTGRLVLAYAARNALLPNLTSFGLALGFVVSGALLTEIVFAYPGQGYLLVGAVASLDYPLIQGLYLTITLAVLGANLLLDLVNLWLDPRLRGGVRPS